MFWHMAGRVKTLIFLRFFKVFRYSGVLEGLVETSWRPCWRILGPRCSLEGYKMNDFGQVGDLGGHLGARMGPIFFKKTSGAEVDVKTWKNRGWPAAEACPVGG